MRQRHELLDGDVALWIAQETVHLKAIDAHRDPVELTPEMCRELAQQLLKLADLTDD